MPCSCTWNPSCSGNIWGTTNRASPSVAVATTASVRGAVGLPEEVPLVLSAILAGFATAGSTSLAHDASAPQLSLIHISEPTRLDVI
eukprot:9176900-Prorocentrum_lima.AAC.1